jgi:hypothetical protein
MSNYTILYHDPEEKHTKLYGPYPSKLICELQIKKWIRSLKNFDSNITIKNIDSQLGGKTTAIIYSYKNGIHQPVIKQLGSFQIFEIKLPKE